MTSCDFVLLLPVLCVVIFSFIFVHLTQLFKILCLQIFTFPFQLRHHSAFYHIHLRFFTILFLIRFFFKSHLSYLFLFVCF